MLPRSVAAAALLAVLLTGCSDEEPAAEPSPTASTSATPTPTPTPAPPEPTEPPLDPLTWESEVHHGQPIGLRRAGEEFLGIETRAVARLDAQGRDVWRRQGPRTDDFRGFVVQGVPVRSVVADGKPKGSAYTPHRVEGLDPRTGKTRWTARATSRYVFADDRVVVVPSCTGRTDGVVGDCTLTAHDPRTGAVVWTTPTYGNVEITQVEGSTALVQTFPYGDEPRFVVLDTRSGDVRSTFDARGGVLVSLVDGVLVDAGRDDAPASSGCRQEVTGTSLDGERLWTRSFKTATQEFEKKTCDGFFAIPFGDEVALSALFSPDLVLDPRTGTTLWKGSRGEDVAGITAGTVIASNDDAGTTAGYDLRTGEQLWGLDDRGGGWDTAGRWAAGNILCQSSDDGSCSLVVDVRTGEVVARVPGVPEDYTETDGRPDGLLLRVDDPDRYAASYGFLSLPPG